VAAEGAKAEADPGPVVPAGILFVLHTGIGWEDLPQELGSGRDDLLASVAALDRSGSLQSGPR
jgi:hypothetical protein